jgi:hypothetical protein
MYGGSIVFFIYCYTVMLRSHVVRHFRPDVRRPPVKSLLEHVEKVIDGDNDSESHMVTTGSLYLRLGCVGKTFHK